jgi:small subunit ribosomal protein S9
MADEEKNEETSEETPTEEPRTEESRDEGASSAGPAAAGDPPPPAVAEASSGEGPPTASPAEEASESNEGQDEASPEDSSDAAEAEQEQGEAVPADDETDGEGPAAEAEAPAPEKKEKKDVIPGADLEPIAVEQSEENLSAEERARREAEAEERARREAALAGDGPDEEPSAASRAPAKLESDARFQATGKRKRSIARVTLLPGTGKFEINKRELEEFFPRPLHQTMARQPLATTGYEGNVDVRVRVHGGGIGGQAGAVRHGIARALTEIDPELRGELKRRGFLTRDARVKERRKAGLKKARKRPQFSKR